MTETYSNPIPVAVALIPCGNKLIAIRRGTPPRVGEIAFPGGHISSGEKFQDALSREVHEETGIQIPPDTWEVFHVGDSLHSDRILLFATCAAIPLEMVNFDFRCEETQQVLLVDPTDASTPFAFELHQQAMKELLKRKKN